MSTLKFVEKRLTTTQQGEKEIFLIFIDFGVTSFKLLGVTIQLLICVMTMEGSIVIALTSVTFVH